jgi:ketosteroid isomerase-like protein
MSQENVEVVRSGFEALAGADLERLGALAQEHVAPDFVFESVLTGRVYTGPQAAIDLASDLRETLEYVPAIEEIIDAGEHVVVVQRISGRGTRSGVPASQRVAVVWTFRYGKIVRGKSFTSRAEALEAVGLSD